MKSIRAIVGMSSFLAVLAPPTVFAGLIPDSVNSEPSLLASRFVGVIVGTPEPFESRWPVLSYRGENNAMIAPLFEEFALPPEFPVQIDDTVSRQNDPDFEVFARYLSDGVDQVLVVDAWDSLGPHGGAGGFESSNIQFYVPKLGPDLVGYTIHHISQSLTVDKRSPGSDPIGDGVWTDWSVTGRYDFYGTVIPEPTTGLLLLLGGVAGLFGKRSRNVASARRARRRSARRKREAAGTMLSPVTILLARSAMELAMKHGATVSLMIGVVLSGATGTAEASPLPPGSTEAVPAPAPGSSLLFSFDRTEGGFSTFGVDGPIEILLKVQSTSDFFDFAELGRGVLWEDGDSGIADFTSETDPHFNDFAARLTNGVDDLVLVLTAFPGLAGGGGGDLESRFGFGSPDLVGSDLERVRLIVHDVHVEMDDQRFHTNVDVSYEFYGAPVPEPTTLLLLGVGAAVLIRRRCVRVPKTSAAKGRASLIPIVMFILLGFAVAPKVTAQCRTTESDQRPRLFSIPSGESINTHPFPNRCLAAPGTNVTLTVDALADLGCNALDAVNNGNPPQTCKPPPFCCDTDPLDK